MSIQNYTCKCTNLPENDVVYLELKFVEHTKCILENYLIYLKCRNMSKYINNISLYKRYSNFECNNEIKNFILSKNTTLNNEAKINNGKCILFLKHPLCNSPLTQELDLLCCNDFINFIKKHVDCQDFDSEIESADKLNSTITKFKF